MTLMPVVDRILGNVSDKLHDQSMIKTKKYDFLRVSLIDFRWVVRYWLNI